MIMSTKSKIKLTINHLYLPRNFNGQLKIWYASLFVVEYLISSRPLITNFISFKFLEPMQNPQPSWRVSNRWFDEHCWSIDGCDSVLPEGITMKKMMITKTSEHVLDAIVAKELITQREEIPFVWEFKSSNYFLYL